MKAIYVTIIFQIGLSPLFAQGDFREGYIITNSKDSLSGFVDYRSEKSNSRVCYFKPTMKSKKVKYSPKDILAYGFIDGKYYITKNIPVKDSIEFVFIEQIIIGKMDLLRYKNVFFIETDTLFKLPLPVKKLVETEQGKKIREINTYKGLLNFTMKDCNLSANKTKYNEKPLTLLVQNYNRCKGEQGQIFKEKIPWTKVRGNLFSGYDMAKFNLNETTLKKLKSFSFVIGASLELSSPKIFDRVFFSFESYYTNKTFQGYSKYGNSISDHFIHLTQVKTPVGVRYNFFNDYKTPYIKIGLVKTINTNIKWNVLTETQSNGVITTDYSSYSLSQVSPLGYWASLGYCRNVYSKLQGYFEVRVEKSPGFVGDGFTFYFSSVSVYNIIIGLRI